MSERLRRQEKSIRFDKFTERARRVMSIAAEVAQSQHSPSVAVGHVFSAIVVEGGGIGVKVLNELGVTTPNNPKSTPWANRSSNDIKPENLSKDVQTVIRFSFREASTLGHHYVGTEHLLLGYLRAMLTKSRYGVKKLLRPDLIR